MQSFLAAYKEGVFNPCVDVAQDGGLSMLVQWRCLLTTVDPIDFQACLQKLPYSPVAASGHSMTVIVILIAVVALLLLALVAHFFRERRIRKARQHTEYELVCIGIILFFMFPNRAIELQGGCKIESLRRPYIA